jgi:hypothetical protein
MPSVLPRKQVNFSLDLDALDILQRYAPPGTHRMGRFVSRLLYEHAIRMEERERFQQRTALTAETEDDGEAAGSRTDKEVLVP